MNEPRATLAAGMQVTPSVRLLSPLGAGGMGAVWLADHTALSTRVVVKFMLGGGLDSSTSARTRFKREAEAASQVKSPHVVQTFDYGVTSEGVPFIVMEHLEGRDLAAEIAARGALDPLDVILVISQVAKALSKAHGAGLLHRDIKPDNIFLCQTEAEDDLFVKLLDFGIAKTPAAPGEGSLDGETKTGQVVGTPFYMSPEQVTAQKVIDLRSDLWSLGVVAYEALTGKRPYDGPSFGALAVKIATGEPPKPSDANPALPPSVDAWFARACAREPSKRFSSARELAEKLRSSFEGVMSLPPIASGGMSDSGPRPGQGPPRGSVPSVPDQIKVSSSSDANANANATTAVDDRVATPGVEASGGPMSIDEDARSRPSFVLASTLSQDSNADRSALARSEPGGAAVAIKDGGSAAVAPSTAPPARSKLVLWAAAIAALVFAIGMGWRARGHADGADDPLPVNPTVKNASTGGPSAPTTESVPPLLAPLGSTTAPLPSSSAPVDDAGLRAAPSASASAPAHPSATLTALTAPRPPIVPPRPPASASASASAKPVVPPAHPSARPGDDPLY